MTILDFVGIDRSKPYPCHHCGKMSMVMSDAGVIPAGIRFLRENYPDGFYVPSCLCNDDIIEGRLKERRQDEKEYAIREEINFLRGFGGDDLDFTFSSIDWQRENKLDVIAADNHRRHAEEWVADGKSLILLGTPGSGKSVILSALHKFYLSTEMPSCFIKPRTLFSRLKARSEARLDHGEVLIRVKRADVLIIDDLLDFEYRQWEAGVLKDIIDFRYNTKRPIHWSSNYHSGDVKQVKADMVKALREESIVDRLFATGESKTQAQRGYQPRAEVRVMNYPSMR